MELTRIDIDARIALANQLRSQALGDFLARGFGVVLKFPGALLTALHVRQTTRAGGPIPLIQS